MRVRRALALASLAAALLGAAGGGCSHKEDDGTAPGGGAAQLPALSIRDDTPNLMLTWVDDKGDTHVELHPPDVPAAGRPSVRVVVSDREDGTRDLFYVVDLTVKQGDGSYAARTMRRSEWEALIDARRRDYLAKNAPPPLPKSDTSPPGSGGAAPPDSGKLAPPAIGVTVIIYGASWCRPCHEAAEYLRSIGVAYVMKDVEKSDEAQREMTDKLEKAGRRTGGIPVIDVRGQILVGFSKSEIDRALRKASTGTVL